MRILITGGAGFIGSHLVKEYCGLGHKIAVVDRAEKKLAKIPKSLNLKYYQSDINSPALDSIFKQFKPDIINHHAASISVSASRPG